MTVAALDLCLINFRIFEEYNFVSWFIFLLIYVVNIGKFMKLDGVAPLVGKI